MLVENRIRPNNQNILLTNTGGNNDEEAVKLLMADYERRIRQVEGERIREREHEGRLLRQLLQERQEW
jgi:hypothetical protein